MLVSVSSFIMIFMEIPDMIRIDPSIPYADFSNPISSLVFSLQLSIILTFVICQSLAWIMPESYKKYLNRKKEFEFTAKKVDLSQEEVLEKLKKGLWD